MDVPRSREIGARMMKKIFQTSASPTVLSVCGETCAASSCGRWCWWTRS